MSQTADAPDMPNPDRTDFLGFELVTGHPPAEGSECAIQTLYEGPPICACCKNWVDSYPEDIRAQIQEQPETKQKAIVVRMSKSHGADVDNGKLLVLDSVVVQSESLKKTLGEVFDGYRGITASLKRLVFKAPFHPFHYRWQRFGMILERQKVDDPMAAGYTQILYDLLRSELDYAMSEIKDMTDHGVITYSKLWALFEPGQNVVATRAGQHQVFVVESSEYNNKDKEPSLVVKAKYIDWDGQKLGYASKELRVQRFSGTRAISELSVCPLVLHPESTSITKKAVERGQKFHNLCGIHYKAYSGTVKYLATRRKEVIRKLDGRVMIDAASYLSENTDEKLTITPLELGSMLPMLDIGDDSHESKTATSTTQPSATDDLQDLDESPSDSGLTNRELMLCSSLVRGFSLKLNRWAKFHVDDINDISWNDQAFPNLMLPDGYKDLLLSFIEKPSQTAAFDDIIEGKGLGTIVLLAGNPGTGKTLTAEAVADHVHRPLYLLNAGELGQRASAVESKLQAVLELTEKWDAILLFDECDVFMQKRTTDNLRHNEIVAVALRILEYYRGILFMTSNRTEMIDRAFESRVHLTLRYPDLDPSAREHIWRQLSSRSEPKSVLTDEEFGRLKELPMNGRHIKNAVKNATMLAARQGSPVSILQIRTVLEATQLVDVSGI